MALRSLATGKKYKNVYTILEKVKKGEIKTHYNYDGGADSGLFSKINFYKKEDLITPHMHYIDERKLGNIVDGYVTDQHNIHQTYNNFSKTKGYQNLPDSVGPDGKAVKPNYEQFQKTVKEVYSKFPKHIKNDIFKRFI